MRQRDYVIVGMRLMGVWTLLTAVLDVRALVYLHFGWRSGTSGTSPEVLWMAGISNTVVGLFLLFLAHLVVDLIYRKPAEPDHPDTTQREPDKSSPGQRA